MTVTETIHHGQYHNTRTGEVDNFAGFVAFMLAGPYATAVIREDNPHVRKAYDGLLASGCGEFGWCRYEAAEPSQNGAASLLVALKGGNITVTHGIDGVELFRVVSARDGTWDALWEWFAAQPGYKLSGVDL